MGSSDLKLLLIAGLIMKLFIVSAVLLAGVAMADPGHGHGHGHRGHGHKRGGYGYRGYYGKREAEPEANAAAEANAEAGADAYYGSYYGGYGLGYGLGYAGLGYGYGGWTWIRLRRLWWIRSGILRKER